jgi:hypothetical protein
MGHDDQFVVPVLPTPNGLEARLGIQGIRSIGRDNERNRLRMKKNRVHDELRLVTRSFSPGRALRQVLKRSAVVVKLDRPDYVVSGDQIHALRNDHLRGDRDRLDAAVLLPVLFITIADRLAP